MLSLKTVLLLAKRVSHICVLSVSPSCLTISATTLQPNPSFTHKSINNISRVISLEAFFPLPHNSEEEVSHQLCLVCTLSHYVLRTTNIRQMQQLFVHYKGHSQGMSLSKQRLSLTLCDAPQGIRAHFTRAISSSTALLRGMAVADIAACRASPCPFIHFYLRDVSESSLTHSVLNVLDSR